MKRRTTLLIGIGIAAEMVGIHWLRGGSIQQSPTPDPTPPQGPLVRFADQIDMDGFLRGNVHVHSQASDGDSAPQQVIAWYREHGYDFLAISDHNYRHDPEWLARFAGPRFVVLAGEEVTMVARGKPVHVNAIGTRSVIGGGRFLTRIEALRWAVGQITEQNGVAIINHPNFAWALETKQLAEVPGARLLDVYNGHPHARSLGATSHPSVEQLWQDLLDRGFNVAPVAVDDAHAFTREPPKGVPLARPGSGWVGVASKERSREAICRALQDGRLYGSNGPVLSRIRTSGAELTVALLAGDATVTFIGMGGEILAEAQPERDRDGSFAASYRLRGDERFVRARVRDRRNRLAWTPAFVTTSFRPTTT